MTARINCARVLISGTLNYPPLSTYMRINMVIETIPLFVRMSMWVNSAILPGFSAPVIHVHIDVMGALGHLARWSGVWSAKQDYCWCRREKPSSSVWRPVVIGIRLMCYSKVGGGCWTRQPKSASSKNSRHEYPIGKIRREWKKSIDAII